ncbi:MAG: ABC transporter permease [Planctomycetes bacterium]|nr:ABC transporter permease [Planctomycetota bacterium]
MSKDADTTKPAALGVPKRRWSFKKLQQASILILVLVLGLYASLTCPTFLTWTNIVDTLFTNAAAIAIIAIGMTFVMIAGGFDLSVGANTAVCAIVLVLTVNALSAYGQWVAIPAGILAACLAGMAMGTINGVLIAYVGVNPFVVTLSTMLVLRGVALVLTNGGQSLMVVEPGLRKTLSSVLFDSSIPLFGPHHRIAIPIFIFLGVLAIGIYLLKYTRFGHYVYAVGGNQEAARLAGVNARRVKAATYVMCGLGCAIAGAILVADATNAAAEAHQGLEFVVIACVIVGGTVLGGGSGGLMLTITGVILLRLIDNLMTQFDVQSAYRAMVTGLMILVVVTIDVLVKKRTKS